MRWIVTEKRSSRRIEYSFKREYPANNTHPEKASFRKSPIRKKLWPDMIVVTVLRTKYAQIQLGVLFRANPAVNHRQRAVLMSRANAPII
jgi:hypothetical protein